MERCFPKIAQSPHQCRCGATSRDSRGYAMIGLMRSLGWALLIVALAPATAAAEGIYFHNKTTGTLEIQTSSIVQGRVVRAPTVRPEPGQKVLQPTQPGNKIVTIYDPRVPNRILYQGPIPASPIEFLHFDIVPDNPPPRVKLETR